MTNNMQKKMIGSVVMLAAMGLSTAMVQAADYVDTVLGNENLISYYRFTEDPSQTSTAVDLSGNGNNGTYNGSPLTTTGPTTPYAPSFGDNNPAVNFDGAGRVLLGTDALDREQITFTGFFSLSEDTVDQRLYTTTNAATNAFVISTSDNGSLVISTANGRVSVDISEELDGEWHHLVVSRSADRNELLVWIDFQPVATVDLGTGTLGRSSVEDVYSIIGARSLSDANAFRGLMDEIAFFDGMFTQSDVDALQAAMLIPEPASLMLLGLGSVLVLSRRRAA